MFPFHIPLKTPEDIKWDIKLDLWSEMGQPIKSWEMVLVKISPPKKSKAFFQERFPGLFIFCGFSSSHNP